MSILYIDEHLHCKNYLFEDHSSFQYFSFEKGFRFNLEPEENHIFLFLFEGEIELKCYCGNIHQFKENSMYALEYGMDYSATCVSDTRFAMLIFEKPQIRCDEFSLIELKKYLQAEKTCIRELTMLPPIIKFFNDSMFYFENKMYCRHLQDLKQSEWFFLMRAFYTKEENAMFLSPLMEDKNNFILMIKQKASKASSVRELAEICNMTPKTLTRNFKKSFKTTPKQWLLQQEKQKIKLELLKSEEKIETVSLLLGFSSASHLSSHCKKHFDQTPKEIRKDL